MEGYTFNSSYWATEALYSLYSLVRAVYIVRPYLKITKKKIREERVVLGRTEGKNYAQ